MRSNPQAESYKLCGINFDGINFKCIKIPENGEKNEHKGSI